MNKAERIKRYGKRAYEKLNERNREWARTHPKEAEAHNREANRKGGSRYDKKQEYMRTGLAGERNRIRRLHAGRYRPFKKIIALESQLHHQWQPGSAGYDGVAIVEKNQHQHGFVDVIRILEGEITLFTEKEIRER